MKVVTFGEIMLRLTPKGYYRLFQNSDMEATFGGGEANVAISLSNFGVKSTFVSRLPQNDIGQSAVKELNKFGVDTSKIIRDEHRIGIYFLEKGASQRPSKVIYDRAHSSISYAENNQFNWQEIFKDTDWFHFTGITPSLSKSVAQVTLEALKVAKENNVTVSCDLNYRKNLWTTKQAEETMTELMAYVDVLIANEEDAQKVFGIASSNTDVDSGQLNREGYKDVAERLVDKFGFTTVFITLRESLSANDNKWSAMKYCNKKSYFSKKYDLHIVDRVGGGDSFAAGAIYSMLNNMEDQQSIEFAVAASALKHSIEGDFNRVSLEEVLALTNGDSTGRVQR